MVETTESRDAAVQALAEARRFVATPSTMSEAESIIAALMLDPRRAAIVARYLLRSTSRDSEVDRLRAFAEKVAASENDTPGTRASARYALTGSLEGAVDEMRRAADIGDSK